MATSPKFRLEDLGRLDHNSRLPLYAQLADMLRVRIQRAQSKLAGEPLPPELDTAAHFGISRPTVRQAMSQLLSEGLIVRGRGRGTFVAPPLSSRHLGRAFEFDVLPANQQVEFRLLSRERIVPNPDVIKALRLRPDDEVQKITRLRFAHDQIFGFEERYLPASLATKLSDAMLKRDSGVVFARRLIEKDNGRVEFRVRAIAADARAADLLKIKKGEPLLSSEHTYFAADDVPVLYGRVLFRGDSYDFSFQAPVIGVNETKKQRRR